MRFELAVERAVVLAGGDRTDFEDLLAVWERVARDTQRRAAAIRSSVARRRCCCADATDFDVDNRCLRCHGRAT